MTSRLKPPSFLPSVAVLEMAYRCNHECLFCSCPWYCADGSFDCRPELTVEQWKQTITELCARGVTDFAFTGGEPLLKEGIVEIIKHAALSTSTFMENKDKQAQLTKANPRLFLLSNGLAMSRSVLKLCKRFNIHLSMSLPGLKTFAYHTGRDNAGEVLSWFEKARRMGIGTTVAVTVTRRNLDELFEVISTGLIAGADTLLMNRFLPGGRGLGYREDLELDADQVVQMLDTAEDVLREADRRGSVGTELPKCLFEGKNYTHLEVGTRCSAAVDFFVVDPSGFVRVCNHSQVRLNHVDEIDSLKDNQYWRRFILKDYLPSKCSGCELMMDCDGGCREAAHIVGGVLDALDPVIPGSFFD